MAEHGEGPAHTYKVDFQVGKKKQESFCNQILDKYLYVIFIYQGDDYIHRTKVIKILKHQIF